MTTRLPMIYIPVLSEYKRSLFDSDHVEQVTAAEQLYGRQLTFRISHGELRSELNLLSEAYSPDILQRAERVLLEQKRKHSWLF